MGFLQNLKDELLATFSTKSVKINLGAVGEITFERDDFLSLWDIQDQLAEIINKTFCEPDVMHIDFSGEVPMWCEESLKKVASTLDAKRNELRKQIPTGQRQILTILEDLRTECESTARKIRNTNTLMKEGNKGQVESESKLDPTDWLPAIVRDFRIRTYPSYRFLIEVLPEGRARERADDFWYAGLDTLSNREKLAMQPNAQLVS